MSNHNDEKLTQAMKDTGGPAFPCEVAGDPSTNEHQTGVYSFMQYGLSLRDYFAAKAMQAAATNPDGANGFTFIERANWAYEQADAMLKERSK